MTEPRNESIHMFKLSGGANVYRVERFGEKLITIAIDTPENAITLDLIDAHLLSMLASDMHRGITRRIDRPKAD